MLIRVPVLPSHALRPGTCPLPSPVGLLIPACGMCGGGEKEKSLLLIAHAGSFANTGTMQYVTTGVGGAGGSHADSRVYGRDRCFQPLESNANYRTLSQSRNHARACIQACAGPHTI